MVSPPDKNSLLVIETVKKQRNNFVTDIIDKGEEAYNALKSVPGNRDVVKFASLSLQPLSGVRTWTRLRSKPPNETSLSLQP
jgi:hypothetical protein